MLRVSATADVSDTRKVVRDSVSSLFQNYGNAPMAITVTANVVLNTGDNRYAVYYGSIFFFHLSPR